MTTSDKILIGIVCERSVELGSDELTEDDFLKEHPDVKIIKVPCSGMIQPIMMETALKEGAAGTFACGCRLGDCHYREGNKFLRERILGTRMPKLKPTVDKSRVQAYWLSSVELDKLLALVAEFKADLNGKDVEPAQASA